MIEVIYYLKILVDYLTILSMFLLIRSSFIISYRGLNNYFKAFQKKNSFLNNYCTVNKSNPIVYRLWGLSSLWLVIRYFEFIKELLRGIYA